MSWGFWVGNDLFYPNPHLTSLTIYDECKRKSTSSLLVLNFYLIIRFWVPITNLYVWTISFMMTSPFYSFLPFHPDLLTLKLANRMLLRCHKLHHSWPPVKALALGPCCALSLPAVSKLCAFGWLCVPPRHAVPPFLGSVEYNKSFHMPGSV